MRRGQHTLRPDNKEDRHTCLSLIDACRTSCGTILVIPWHGVSVCLSVYVVDNDELHKND